MVILILKAYLVLLTAVLIAYFIRHCLFTLNRMLGEQRLSYQDIVDSDLPSMTVIVPMHNEEKVASNILDLLAMADYPREKLEIIPVNNHSTDSTGEIIERYRERYAFIKPLLRGPNFSFSGRRGKPAALNDAMMLANGEIVAVFDADYLPTPGILRDIAVSFKDFEVGAVMGRVIPVNAGKNLLTRLLDLERSGGYQVDQQARYNLRLIPQYGGTVGGFRKDLVLSLGGFDPDALAEDTELTFRLVVNGWKVVYANRAECYEEAPETWEARARQMERWARGHTRVMLRYFFPLLKSPRVTMREKVDGAMLLAVYAVSPLLLLGTADSVALFFLGRLPAVSIVLVFMAAGFNTFGNFAPFYEIGAASLLDGSTFRVRLLPLLLFSFLFNMCYTAKGLFDALVDAATKRKTHWNKTERFGVADTNGGAGR